MATHTLADKLDVLFRTVHRPDGREYSYRDVAHEIERQCHLKVSPSYIWQLRTGQRDNPTVRHLEALATVFGISPTYFLHTDEAEQTQAELSLLAALRDVGIRTLALRAHGLSAESLESLRELVERVRQLERIPEPPAPHHVASTGTDDTSGPDEHEDTPADTQSDAATPQGQPHPHR